MSHRGVRLKFRDIGTHQGASSLNYAPALGTYVRTTRVNTGSDRRALIEFLNRQTLEWEEWDSFSQKAGDFDDNAGDAAVAVGDDGSMCFLLSAGDGGKDFEIRDGTAYYPPQLTGFPTIDGRRPIQFTSGIEDAFARQQIAAISQAVNNATSKAADAASKANEMTKLVKDEVKKAVGKATGGLDENAVLKIVSDDLAAKDGAGNYSGRLRHALFPLVEMITDNRVFLMLKNAASPLINVIKQGGRPIQ